MRGGPDMDGCTIGGGADNDESCSATFY